jgi:serine/threonine-protein kinase
MRRTKDLEDSVKNQGNKLITLRAFSIGFSAALLALACGSDDNNNTPPDNDPTDLAEPDRDTCEDNPYLAECEPPPPDTSGELDTGDPPDTTDPVTPPVQEDEVYLEAKALAENVLKSNCGGCHGTQLTPETARARMNYIDSIDKLIENDKLIPGQAEESIVIRRMRLGEMPPAAEGFPPVADADINVVANFINNPDFFDFEENVVCDDVIDFDTLYTDVAEDIGREDAEDAVFIRYISLANRVTSGVCASGTALDRDRQALIKMMNALSVNARITEPEAIDTNRTLYKIDLRDYNWDVNSRPNGVDVNGVNFVDVWEAIIAANVYAVPFVGDQADDARADAGTDVPVMFLDSMLDAATVGNLYYAILEIDVNQTLDDYILNVLEVDLVDNQEQEISYRAGTTKSRISRQDRVVQGDPIEDYTGALYQSFDFADVDGNDNIFEDPFGFQEGGTEAVFNLPNGMLAFIIADANGAILEDSDILLDTNQGNFRALTSVSCSGCHATGFIPVVDEVKDIVVRNARDLIANGTLDQEELDQLREIYLEPEEFAAEVERDSSVYLDALEDANLPIRGADPISATFLRFDRDVTIADAAGDLGVSVDDLDGELNNLDETLQVLGNGNIDRDDFTDVYVASLCVMSGLLDNQPDVDLCNDAIAALDQ